MISETSQKLIHELSVNNLDSTLVVDLHPFLTVKNEDLILGYARSVRPVRAQFIFSSSDHTVSIVGDCLLSYVPSNTGHSRWQLNTDKTDWELLNPVEYILYGEFLRHLKQHSALQLSLYNPKHIKQLDLALATLQAGALGAPTTGSVQEITRGCMDQINKDFAKFFEA